MILPELFGIQGKVAVVTGCARGLGREIALCLAKSGASLVLADRDYPEETANEILGVGSRCVCFQTDVTDEAGIRKLAEDSIAEFQKVDILVNNAGISQLSYTATEDMSIEEWDKVIDVNLRGTFLCCKHIGKEMINRKSGTIINIASTAGITGVPRAPAYCASKAGVILLTKSLALEWAKHNIRINAVAPHYLKTDLTKGLMTSESIYSSILKRIPLNRFGSVSDVIGIILLLSSGASSYMTGAVIPVDGGYLAQ